jgi:glycosyltransferase involved in cell wall biosynthesis
VRVPKEGPIRVLYHGGTATRFGVQTLIQAVGRLKANDRQVKLKVLGAGQDRDRLRTLAREVAPDRIEVADEVPFARIPDELAAAHVGVVPTLRDDFTELLLPVKLLEDIHVGLPVIASNLPGIAAYFSGDELRFTPPGDDEALADAILDVCRDPEAAARRTARAQARLQSISWANQRATYLALIDDLAMHSRRGRRRCRGL